VKKRTNDQRDVASEIARELLARAGDHGGPKPDDIRDSRTMQHAAATMHGLPETPRHNAETGRLELPSTEELAQDNPQAALDRIARVLIDSGKMSADDYDPALSGLAAEVQRERRLNEDAPDESGSSLNREAIIEKLAEAVMRRRREGM